MPLTRPCTATRVGMDMDMAMVTDMVTAPRTREPDLRFRMKRWWGVVDAGAVIALALGVMGCASRHFYGDSFRGGIGKGWTVLREQRDAWRTSPEGLQVRVLPGNMWGGSNDAKNTFVREAMDPAQGPVEVQVRVENHPTEQYEQVDLVWYYSDSHQVKIGQELVDGKLSIVMGREENDRTRTIAIIPLDSDVVELRHVVNGNRIEGFFRTPAMKEWKSAGTCDLPVLPSGPKISLQVYQGPARVERWARLWDFSISQKPTVR